MKAQNRINRPLLYQEVVDELYKMIDQEQIKPGDKLPSERELTDRLGISRNVLREAFHVLEGRGIIVSMQGSGRYLREVSDKYSTTSHGMTKKMSRDLEKCSMVEAYEVRQTLEVKAVEMLVQNASDDDIKEIKLAYQQMKKRFEETGLTVGEFELHRMYAKKSGNRFMEQTLSIVLSAILDMMSNTFRGFMVSHETEKELAAHRKIINAIEERNAEKAKLCMYDHIQVTIDMMKELK